MKNKILNVMLKKCTSELQIYSCIAKNLHLFTIHDPNTSLAALPALTLA